MKDLLKEKNADFNRPYERCLMYGPASLSDAELLAVIIRSGTVGTSAIELANKILHLSRSDTGLLALCHLSIQELTELPGIGQVKAIQLKCVGELSKRIAMYSAKQELSFSDPCSIADYYMEQLRHEEKESLFCMMLDTKNNFIGDECISKGTVNYAVLSTRELFLTALRYRAVSIILVHNHPSGDPSPSEEDILLTERVREAGKLLNIRLLDHIVIGDKRYISFMENGILKEGE
ncbi:MAG: DNA repair protein RadC [Lachnospiraceae bacterium]|nr:DNA repair protein RadC [Lachnospiraceae bacterium]